MSTTKVEAPKVEAPKVDFTDDLDPGAKLGEKKAREGKTSRYITCQFGGKLSRLTPEEHEVMDMMDAALEWAATLWVDDSGVRRYNKGTAGLMLAVLVHRRADLRGAVEKLLKAKANKTK
jgi:hypothetical protein